MPGLFEVVPNTTEGIDALPTPDVPYYVLAQEGMFLHRKTQIGNVLLPEYKKPPTLAKTGYPQGVFLWSGPKIPATIISQAASFFKRILAKHHSEAEVLITMHNETGAFRLFVPFQRVSHTGVKSVYEPTHIDRNYTVVGTLHSHCDFSAFHSGTDSADASDMDGIHFTIGMLNHETPEIVAMVAMNGKEFHYKDPSTVAEIDYTADTAPEWWDQYVFPASTESVKPKSLRSLTQEQWDEFRGLATKKPKVHKPPTSAVFPYTNGYGYQPAPRTPSRWATVPSEDSYGYDDYGNFYRYGAPKRDAVSYINDYLPKKTTESTKFNKRNAKRRKYQPHWSEDGTLVNYRTADEIQIDLALSDAETSNVLTIEDFDGIAMNQLDSIEYWRLHFTAKMEAIADILDTLGMKVTYSIKPSEPPTQVEGQIGLYDLLPEG